MNATDERMHPVRNEPAWSESYYFNFVDPDTRLAMFTRMGFRPGDGWADGLHVVYLGGDRVAFTYGRRSIDADLSRYDHDLSVGGLRIDVYRAVRHLACRLFRARAGHRRRRDSARAQQTAAAGMVSRCAARDVRRLRGDQRAALRGVGLPRPLRADGPGEGRNHDRRPHHAGVRLRRARQVLGSARLGRRGTGAGIGCDDEGCRPGAVRQLVLDEFW